MPRLTEGLAAPPGVALGRTAAAPAMTSTAESRVIRGTDATVLDRIGDPGCAAAIWACGRDAALGRWLDGLSAAFLPRTRRVLRPDQVGAAVLDACDAALTPQPDRCRALADLVQDLANGFAAAMGVRWLRLRLDAVDTDGCRRFHRDVVRARLLCTLRGSGTEFGIATDSTAEPDRIERMATGDVGVFRGTLWPGGVLPLVHRSPPIAGRGETRLLLVLDPLDDPEDG